MKIQTGDTTRYVYDNKGHLLFERSSGSYSQRSYVWLDDIPLAVIDQKRRGNCWGVFDRNRFRQHPALFAPPVR
ncbi:hypothetical protein [Methylovulum psychrotolerans]|uniref:RHS repeat protein n=1 Tax=Methylovulum psychrotolerans TaxID=1704499 RepID=A0A1Z4C1Q3_9GAMM|nr:hypothetical protein [Methylovulum psychrotolerans]ASF47435.1 hypothetical protein CEK71_15955 [Methylovulum psychrotolerans]